MTGHNYNPELIAWVRRTTAAQGVSEQLDPDTFVTRVGALFDAQPVKHSAPLPSR